MLIFCLGSGSELWHSVYGLSATGKKRGRGKMLSQAKKINLNKGQFMGKGIDFY